MLGRLRQIKEDFLMGPILPYAATLIFQSQARSFACCLRIELTCHEDLSRIMRTYM